MRTGFIRADGLGSLRLINFLIAKKWETISGGGEYFFQNRALTNQLKPGLGGQRSFDKEHEYLYSRSG